LGDGGVDGCRAACMACTMEWAERGTMLYDTTRRIREYTINTAAHFLKTRWRCAMLARSISISLI
jgi:hypothetical protein